ncbi:hypothetical protein F444_07325 [Phytophthora nicotianae P1976]|uniref:SET domain-containing protein n=2 Tax=Phytophthora nicotianae TaxID=4792 RepID=A0A081AF27_PHYNI|nr:hypothetical protein F444_07325 [Phytophthora nicotianae P1976]
MVHSATYWRERCIADSSTEEENTPPNLRTDAGGELDGYSSTGTWSVLQDTPPRKPKTEETLPIGDGLRAPATPPHVRPERSPTTSSPVMLGAPPSPLLRPRRSIPLREHRSSRQERRAAVDPYRRRHGPPREPELRSVNPKGLMRSSPISALKPRIAASRSRDRFIPADWPYQVANLRAQFNPTGLVFPTVPHFGWCGCTMPCRVGTYRNSLMQMFYSPGCCPYDATCGNALGESSSIYLARNVRTRQLAVVATEDIDAGEVLDEYLGELEHLSVNPAGRPRNEGYRLVMTQRPERPTHPIRVAINAADMGGLMHFVNHSCAPVAQFIEVANGRRTTVVVATTEHIREGEEITVDYGTDLWFVCRCGLETCRHREIQKEQDT